TGAVAHFTGAAGDSPSEFMTSINWGDGHQSAGTLVGSGGGYDVTGTHTYQENGSYQIIVQIIDLGGSRLTATASASITEAAIVGTPARVPGTEAASLNNVTAATFTHGSGVESPSGFSAVIDWGDGSAPSTGTISISGNVYSVLGTHTYADERNYA